MEEQRKPKYHKKDKVLASGWGYIYIIDDYYYDEELKEFIYITHGLDSYSTVKSFPESKLFFSGVSFF